MTKGVPDTFDSKFESTIGFILLTTLFTDPSPVPQTPSAILDAQLIFYSSINYLYLFQR